MLVVFAVLWGWYWFQVRTRVDGVVRRELQAFDLSYLSRLISVRSSINPVYWSFMVTGSEVSDLSVRAYRSNESFEEMRERQANYVKIPIWPGLLALTTGIVAIAWMNRIGGVLLITFALIWGWYHEQVRGRVDGVIRRELQAFDSGHCDYLTAVRPTIDPVIWSQMVFESDQSIPSLKANGGTETFEQMRARHARYFKIPVWPGLFALITGIIAVAWIPNIEQGRRKTASPSPAT